MIETYYDVMRRQASRAAAFVKFCSLTAASLGLGAPVRSRSPRDADEAAHAGALAARPRMHLLHRVVHPLVAPAAKDVVLSMISLDYTTR
jgi:hydrogenase small subunit